MSDLKMQELTIEELKKYDGKEGRQLYVLIEDKIYDLSTYAHPGGMEVFEQGEDYQDLHEKFLEVGHSSTADRLMKKYLVGVLKL